MNGIGEGEGKGEVQCSVVIGERGKVRRKVKGERSMVKG